MEYENKILEVKKSIYEDDSKIREELSNALQSNMDGNLECFREYDGYHFALTDCKVKEEEVKSTVNKSILSVLENNYSSEDIENIDLCKMSNILHIQNNDYTIII